LRSGGREVARGSAVAVMPPESSRARRGTSPSQRIPSYVGGRTRRYAVRGVTTAPTWVRVVRAAHDVVTTPCHRTKGGTRDRNRCPRVAPSGRPPAGSGAPRPADPAGPGARARGRRPPTVGRGPLGACPAHGHRLRRAGRPRRGARRRRRGGPAATPPPPGGGSGDHHRGDRHLPRPRPPVRPDPADSRRRRLRGRPAPAAAACPALGGDRTPAAPPA